MAKIRKKPEVNTLRLQNGNPLHTLNRKDTGCALCRGVVSIVKVKVIKIFGSFRNYVYIRFMERKIRTYKVAEEPYRAAMKKLSKCPYKLATLLEKVVVAISKGERCVVYEKGLQIEKKVK